MKNKIEFSNDELLEIHQALQNKRKRVIQIKGEKLSISKEDDIREIKYKSFVFTPLCEKNTNFATPDTTIAINKAAPLTRWNVIAGDKVYKNKKAYYGRN